MYSSLRLALKYMKKYDGLMDEKKLVDAWIDGCMCDQENIYNKMLRILEPSLSLWVLIMHFFFFLPCPQHAEVPRPGDKPMPQL